MDVADHIIGQQISTSAQKTIWHRMCASLGVTPASIESTDAIRLQANGITFKKAEYIKDFAGKVIFFFTSVFCFIAQNVIIDLKIYSFTSPQDVKKRT